MKYIMKTVTGISLMALTYGLKINGFDITASLLLVFCVVVVMVIVGDKS